MPVKSYLKQPKTYCLLRQRLYNTSPSDSGDKLIIKRFDIRHKNRHISSP